MKNNFIACMVLHAVGDTVGYKNTEWEFMKGPYEKTLEKVYQLINLGGVTHVNLDGWRVSDDTILHMKTAEAILTDFESINSMIKILIKHYIEAYDQFIKEGINYRSPGNATMKAIEWHMKNKDKWDTFGYNFYAGGSGASMRSLCVGLAYSGQENRYKLIQVAIESSRLTHNSVVGYLGGFTAALFAALAIEKVDIKEWPFMLVDMIKNEVSKYIKQAGRDIMEFEKDKHIFLKKWTIYMDDKFDQKRELIKRRTTNNLVFRGKYYAEKFSFRDPNVKSDGNGIGLLPNNAVFVGSGGDDSVIIAYDSLVDSEGNWEKLVYYSMLHCGDTDTTGSIAAGLYGCMYGMHDVSSNFIDHLEYHDELVKLGGKLYDKFYGK